MIIADLAQITGRVYPARRRTQNLVGGMSSIQASNFCMGNVTLEPNGRSDKPSGKPLLFAYLRVDPNHP